MMRVLYWTQHFWPYVGGVEVQGAQFLPAMRSRGHEFVVVTSHGELPLPDEAMYEGVPVQRFPFLSSLASADVGQLLQTSRRVAMLKQRFRPDLVHLHFTDPSVFFHMRTAAAYRAPCLVTIGLALPTTAGTGQAQTLLGQTLRSAAWVTAPSGAILGNARSLVPEIADRSSVIYNALEWPDLPPTPLPREDPVLLCVGRVVDDKGFDLTVAAFALVLERVPGALLVIVGDGPARPALERQAASLGLSARVRFAGWVAPERVPALINEATVVVMSSRWQEAFGLVALQASQMARPIVATRVGGLPEVVLDGVTGLLVPPEDPEELARALTFLLEHPDEAARLGHTGRLRAKRAFGWANYVEAYDRLYHTLCPGGSPC
jgi:glycogen(starch) synthase